MRLRHSLRAKLALNLALFCILFIGTLTAAVHLVTERQEHALIDRIVGDEVATLIDKHKADPSLRSSIGHGSFGYVARSAADRLGLPDYLRTLAPGKHDLTHADKALHVVVRERAAVTYYLAYDVAHHQQRMTEFGWLLAAGVVATVTAALSLGFWWSGHIIRQLADLAQRLDDLKPGDADTQFAAASMDDELARLVVAFDNYQIKMLQLVEREKEFSANVSHELRTPLTLIQTSCELLAQDPQLSGKSQRHVGLIAHGSQHMTELIRWFLVLAREGSLGERERVPIRECVDEAILPLLDVAEKKGLALSASVAPMAALYTNREALYLVLTNLLRNAVEYTDHGGVTVRYLANKLYVEDTGRGIAETEIANIFVRFYRVETSLRDHDGLGLGLAIVKRICDHYAWRINVKSAVGAGTTISIEFPLPTNLF